jgi:hypothetical protein
MDGYERVLLFVLLAVIAGCLYRIARDVQDIRDVVRRPLDEAEEAAEEAALDEELKNL